MAQNYTVAQLAQLAGVSGRTLRYYDQIGLLNPQRMQENNYRFYGPNEVDRLQQILFYRELEMPLEEIAAMVDAPGYNRKEALLAYKEQLLQRKNQLEKLLETVEKTIDYEKGVIEMQDKEKFENFKKELLQKNEEQYGEEVRQKYGDDAVSESNRRMMNLTKEEYDAMTALATEMQEALKAAVLAGEDAAGETGQKIANMHKTWLGYTWGDKIYSVQAHKGLTEMYLADERFKAYYDSEVEGCAQFLHDAVHIMYG